MNMPRLSVIGRAVALAAILTLMTGLLTAKAQDPQPTVVATTTDNMRLRAGPGTNFPQVGLIPPATALPVLGRNPASDWLYVEYRGTHGWIAGWFCDISGDLSSIPVQDVGQGQTQGQETPTAGTVLAVATRNVRIRSGPHISASALGVFPAGASTTVLGRNRANSWLQIEYGGRSGWVTAWFCTISGNLNDVPMTSSDAPYTSGRSITAWEYHDTHFSQEAGVKMRPEWFEDQLRWLAENGYHAVTSEELVGYLNGAELPARSIVLTFDLGDRQLADYEYTVSLLQKYHLHGIFFLVTNSIHDDCTLNWPCWDALARWQATGAVSYGSHSVSHRSFRYLSLEERLAELIESKRVLEEHLGPILGFATPYEYTPHQMWDLLKAAGYHYSFGGNSRADLGIHPYDELWWNLPRLLPYSNETMYPLLSARAHGETFADLVVAYTTPQ